MKRVILLTITIAISNGLYAKGDYQKEVYAKRLSVAPTMQIAVLGGMPVILGGVNAQFNLNKKLGFEALVLPASGVGEDAKGFGMELSGKLFITNKVTSKIKKIYDPFGPEGTKGNSRYFTIKNLPVDVLKQGGFRVGFNIIKANEVRGDDVQKAGFATTTKNNSVTNKTIALDNFLDGPDRFNYSNTGLFAGVFRTMQYNHTNTEGHTGLSAKGRKNQFVKLGADVLFGVTNTVFKTTAAQPYKDWSLSKNNKPYVGARAVIGYGLYFGNSQNVCLSVSSDIGYLTTTKLFFLMNAGLTINLLNKYVTKV